MTEKLHFDTKNNYEHIKCRRTAGAVFFKGNMIYFSKGNLNGIQQTIDAVQEMNFDTTHIFKIKLATTLSVTSKLVIIGRE